MKRTIEKKKKSILWQNISLLESVFAITLQGDALSIYVKGQSNVDVQINFVNLQPWRTKLEYSAIWRQFGCDWDIQDMWLNQYFLKQ